MLDPQVGSPIADSFPQHDLASLFVLTRAATSPTAFEEVQPMIEAVTDDLSFQMQAPVHIVAFDLLDVTEPVTLGEERDVETHAAPEATLAPKFSGLPPDFTWNEFPVELPRLEASASLTGSGDRMALWWYVKSLDAPYAVDKFICLWTAAEILWDASDVRVLEPYVAPCRHVVDSCPDCGEAVSRVVRGASLKQFLIGRADVSPGDAAGLWQLRQLVHGRNVFNASRLEALGRLVSVLRAAVLRLLKVRLGYRLDECSLLVRADGPILGHMMILCGRRVIDEDDVEVVAYLTALLE